MALVPFDVAPELRPETEWAGRQVLVVGVSSVALSPPADSYEALVQVQDQAVRMTTDGSVPTATNGIGWNADDWFRVTGRGDMIALRFIREGAADGTLEVNYYVRVD